MADIEFPSIIEHRTIDVFLEDVGLDPPIGMILPRFHQFPDRI
jgi:hypothetical protein